MAHSENCQYFSVHVAEYKEFENQMGLGLGLVCHL